VSSPSPTTLCCLPGECAEGRDHHAEEGARSGVEQGTGGGAEACGCSQSRAGGGELRLWELRSCSSTGCVALQLSDETDEDWVRTARACIALGGLRLRSAVLSLLLWASEASAPPVGAVFGESVEIGGSKTK